MYFLVGKNSISAVKSEKDQGVKGEGVLPACNIIISFIIVYYLPCIELLKIDNMREVLDSFWNFRARWKMIGIELGIDMGTLDSIRANNNMQVEGCVTDMIAAWLRGNNPRPTRSAMAAVLLSERVNGGATLTQGELLPPSGEVHSKEKCELKF